MLAQKHRQRARPDAVAVVLPEQIARAVGVDEDVAVDHPAGHRAVWRSGQVDRGSGEKRLAIVDERSLRARALAPARSQARSISAGRCRRPNIRRRPGPSPAPNSRRLGGHARSTPAAAPRGRRTPRAPSGSRSREWRIGKASSASLEVASR